MGCDSAVFSSRRFERYFNPRTPYGVRPVIYGGNIQVLPKFQSTHPVWGATNVRTDVELFFCISIHAPRMGCDTRPFSSTTVLSPFQSTHPVWGATRVLISSLRSVTISIHAPRMGCDSFLSALLPPTPDFNPRTPYGVRRSICSYTKRQHTFQSTHPVWGATLVVVCLQREKVISIHAPRMGCDGYSFLSGAGSAISIHAPRMGCDFVVRQTRDRRDHFNPRTPYGVRRA